MEPINAATIAALSASAASGIGEITKKAIQDGYNLLKSLITKKLGNKSEAAEAIDKLEAKPESQGRQQTLAEELKEANLGSDLELVSAAQSLLQLINTLPQGG